MRRNAQRVFPWIAVIAAMAVLLGSTAALASSAAPRCGAVGGVTRFAGATVTVQQRSGRTYACRRPATGTKALLLGRYIPANPSSNAGQRLFRAAGRFLAFEDHTLLKNSALEFRTAVYDLASGKRVCRAATAPFLGSLGQYSSRVGTGHLTAVAITETGDAAWIAEDANRLPTTYVVSVCHEGITRVLDRSAGIAPTSLAISADTATWQRDGAPKSAPLRPG